MRLEDFNLEFEPLPGAVPAWQAQTNAVGFVAAAAAVRRQGGRLAALWASDAGAAGFALHALLAAPPGLLWLNLPIARNAPTFPSLSTLFPVANRRERAIFDLLGLRAQGGADQRPWLRHGAWPADWFPLRQDTDGQKIHPAAADDYPFVPVSGEGVHEIPVGPVHAGTIEPGHFRFQVVGEQVLRLEERLGYKHKGVEKRFQGMPLLQAARLAGRISGDSTVAYAWAYAQAIETACGLTPPARALWLRALFLERERIANHLGDLGALGNDAGLAFGLAQFSRLKEDVLRLHHALFHHRYLMDTIVPGGVACDIETDGIQRLQQQAQTLVREVKMLQEIYDEHAGMQDRFIATGRVVPELAAHLGLIGLAGRASGQTWDNRTQFPCEPYRQLDVRMVTHRNGDVAARALVRFEELYESLRLCNRILTALPSGAIHVPLPAAKEGGRGLGWVEGWRGEVVVAVEMGGDQRLRWAHVHDPSWHNWPALEYAVIGNIVPDFPLINKSFNLSYSGHDL